MTYAINLAALTIIATDETGESYDLNASGEPCVSADDLRAFVAELHNQGAYDAATRDALLASF